MFARPVGSGFFPLDDELGLLPGSLTPRLHETLVRLSTTHPSFAKATAELAWLTGTTLHSDTARRRTETAGACLLAHSTTLATTILHEHPAPPAGPDTLVFSVDGAMVPLVKGQWKEVRTLAVGAVQPAVLKPDGIEIHTTSLSYFSRLTDSTSVADLAVVELHRRGIERAGRVGAVVDGAEWCQTFIDYHYPEAVRILDLPHAGEYLSVIGQGAGADGPLLSGAQLQQLRDDLREQGPRDVLEVLRAVVGAQSDKPEVNKALAYLEKRSAQMHYPEFVADGWPIGSGMVESANKLVVEERLKGAGMHWQEGNVNPLLALRNALCNERWQESWAVIEQELRHQAKRQRDKRRGKPTLASATPITPPREPSSAMPAAPPAVPTEPELKPPHPWKRAWSVRRQRELANSA